MSEFSDAVSKLGLSYSVEYLGEGLEGTWRHDVWDVTIGGETFRYRTGTGHRVDGLAVDPPLADVLWCLIRDGEACNMTFEDWCGEYGYDSDSRTAERTYVRCVETGHRVARVTDIEPLAYLEH